MSIAPPIAQVDLAPDVSLLLGSKFFKLKSAPKKKPCEEFPLPTKWFGSLRPEERV